MTAIAKPLHWRQRIDNDVRETGFPLSMFILDNGKVIGLWEIGNNYSVRSKYHGGYPASYLRRVKSLFPEKKRILHAFSGKVDLRIFPGDTVDINPALRPTFLDDCQTLELVPLESYDLVAVDPPYTGEDADHYGTTLVSRQRVMEALTRVRRGTHVVWLDQVQPMYRKADWAIEADIGVKLSTNHRFRIVTVFRRK